MPARRSRSGRCAASSADPHHPYTAALLAALPERAHARRLPSIPGVVPGQFDRPVGCLFSPRCTFATDLCRTVPPRAPRGQRSATIRCATGSRPTIPERRMPHEHGSRRPRSCALLSGLARRLPRAGDIEGARRRKLLARARQDTGGGRRIRLRKVDAGPPRHHDRAADLGLAHDRRQGDRRRFERNAEELALEGADRLPESLWLAQSAPEDRPYARRAAAGQYQAEPPPSAPSGRAK